MSVHICSTLHTYTFTKKNPGKIKPIPVKTINMHKCITVCTLLTLLKIHRLYSVIRNDSTLQDGCNSIYRTLRPQRNVINLTTHS